MAMLPIRLSINIDGRHPFRLTIGWRLVLNPTGMAIFVGSVLATAYW